MGRAAEVRRLATHGGVWRALAVWGGSAATLWAAALLLDGMTVDGVRGALVLALVLGLMNALVWPLVTLLALPLAVLTLGSSSLAMNGLFLWLAAEALGAGDVAGYVPALLASLLVTATNLVLATALSLEDDDFWYRNVVRRRARRAAGVEPTDVPGVCFLEIDGLAYDVLRRAMRDGNAPTIARWVREGSHRLAPWECDWSSQTGAMQAGILHGSNDDMPGFRWWEKERDAAIVSNDPRGAMEIERRRSDGRGLLHKDGASRANLLSGDAPHTLLTMSTVLRRDRPGRIGHDYYAYFANPYNVFRTLALVAAEVWRERRDAAWQLRSDVRPRVERGRVYALLRAWATVIQRDLQVHAVLHDVYAGRPVVYTTFLGYDEVAHHSGIERRDALATLRRIDRELARLERALGDAPRPYALVVLSDHGQTQGATFRQRYGETLEELVRRHVAEGRVEAAVQGDEGWAYLGASLTEAAAGEGAIARATRAATRRASEEGVVTVGRERDETGRRVERPPEPGPERRDGPPEVVVMASGCLGLVSFPDLAGRVHLERLEVRHPGLVEALRSHPGIGFVLVRSAAHGALALGPRGTAFLDEERVEGEDPLAPFGPNAAHHVRRTDGFPHCADLMVNSAYWPETGEVAAFEELVGSHGGLGGTQGTPFVCYPSGWGEPGALVGAEALHRALRGWLADAGHPEYAAAAAEPPTPVEAR